MYDLSKLFLHCLNFWKLETPSSRKLTMSAEDIATYKVRDLVSQNFSDNFFISICLMYINIIL
jgi:hypothetical protein